jgi:hypothetical protein
MEWLSNKLLIPIKNLFLFDDYGEAVKWILEKYHWDRYYPVVVEETFWYKFNFNVKYYPVKKEEEIYLGGYPGRADVVICFGGRNQLGHIVNYESASKKIVDLTFGCLDIDTLGTDKRRSYIFLLSNNIEWAPTGLTAVVLPNYMANKVYERPSFTKYLDNPHWKMIGIPEEGEVLTRGPGFVTYRGEPPKEGLIKTEFGGETYWTDLNPRTWEREKEPRQIWIDGNWYSGVITVETDNGVARGDFKIKNYHGPDEIGELRIFGHCVDIFKNVKLSSDRKTYQSDDIYVGIPSSKGDTLIDGKKYFVERG